MIKHFMVKLPTSGPDENFNIFFLLNAQNIALNLKVIGPN